MHGSKTGYIVWCSLLHQATLVPGEGLHVLWTTLYFLY